MLHRHVRGEFDRARSHPPDGWDDDYALPSVTSCSTKGPHDLDCEIDKAFFDDVWANPLWLLDDATRIEPVTHTNHGVGFQLINVASGDIADALGFKTRDDLLDINGKSFSSLEDAIEFHHDNRDTDEFTVKVERSGTHLELFYEVTP